MQNNHLSKPTKSKLILLSSELNCNTVSKLNSLSPLITSLLENHISRINTKQYHSICVFNT